MTTDTPTQLLSISKPNLQLALCIAFKEKQPFRQLQETFEVADQIWLEIQKLSMPQAYIVKGRDITLADKPHIGSLKELSEKLIKSSAEEKPNIEEPEEKASAEKITRPEKTPTEEMLDEMAKPNNDATNKAAISRVDVSTSKPKAQKKKNNLPPVQLTVLKAIIKLTDLNSKEITGRAINAMCEKIDQRASNLTETLRALENKGYIDIEFWTGSANTIKLLKRPEGL